MPVQEAIPYSEALGNGVSKSFALGFPCEKKEYLIVKVGDVQTSEWSLSNNTVTFTTAPELNVFIQFKRETKIERTTDYATYNDSLRGEVLNKDFDKVYEILQENKSDTTQYKPDYEYSVAKANEAHQIASEAYDLAELTEIEHGGTGARNINGARENLGIYSKEEVDALVATGGQGNIVPIEGGGTGADNAVGARENLSVYSKQEVDSEISNATPNATETTAGKAKIATTAIAQAGVNDTDFITASKLAQTVLGMGQTRKSLSLVSGTTYTNTSGRLKLISIWVNNSPSAATLEVGGFSSGAIGSIGTSGGGAYFTFALLPSESFKVSFAYAFSAWEVS